MKKWCDGEKEERKRQIKRGSRYYVPVRELVRAGKRDDAGYAGEWIPSDGQTQSNDVLLFEPRGYYLCTLLTSIATQFRVSGRL